MRTVAKKPPNRPAPPAPPPPRPPNPAVPAPQHEALRGEIERQVGPLLQGREREQVVSRLVSIVVEETFRGPLPHPKHLQAYDAVVPGAANRIIQMAEDANRHNIDVAAKQQIFDNVYQTKGLYLGFAALIALILAAVYCGMNGQPWLGGLFLGAGAVGVVGRFVHGRSSKTS